MVTSKGGKGSEQTYRQHGLDEFTDDATTEEADKAGEDDIGISPEPYPSGVST